ncbi:hypothetical protein N7478_010995 [Penicillium angulare]|uniref:uncharacterized protein n=1 Tax=Penicillium angulare TaxID=116970 RepID=UPI002541DFCC|nr:uncharacterized protein N7478_010995 [Penicillium angulare]KAJ5263390.1 hypothetical protein N7478_010995 [Penicillium angulare]
MDYDQPHLKTSEYFEFTPGAPHYSVTELSLTNLSSSPLSTSGSSISTRPQFHELPLQPHHPKGSAWGLWGAHDERGTLNLLSEDVVRAAGMEVLDGKVVSLNLPIDVPLKPMNPRRKKCSHTIIAKGHANDDEIDFNTQSSSHWDGLRHFPYSDSKIFYNGVTQDDISGPDANTKIGIQSQSTLRIIPPILTDTISADLATKPIVSRGVLLDWYSYAQREGLQTSPFTNQAIPLSHLENIATEQGITFNQGDVLLIRTGWTAAYHQLSEGEKENLGGRDDRASCGVEATEESIRWHWEQGFAAVASDTVAYEAWPSPKTWGVSMHEASFQLKKIFAVFLSGWGMPIGECWDLEELSRTCQALGRWTFMLTSQPLNVPGGVASPANATAIF